MTAIAKASLSNLHRRFEAALAQIARTHPHEAEEMRLLFAVIRQREASTGIEFAGVRAPRKAIELCLVERGSPMTKQQILDRLVDGGFVKSVDTEKWLINDAINHGLEKKYLYAMNDAPKWEALIGLPMHRHHSTHKPKNVLDGN